MDWVVWVLQGFSTALLVLGGIGLLAGVSIMVLEILEILGFDEGFTGLQICGVALYLLLLVLVLQLFVTLIMGGGGE